MLVEVEDIEVVLATGASRTKPGQGILGIACFDSQRQNAQTEGFIASGGTPSPPKIEI